MSKTRTFLLCAAALCAAAARAAQPAPGPQDGQAAAIAQARAFLSAQAIAYRGTPHIDIDASRLQNMPACRRLEFFLPGNAHLRSRMSVGVRCAAPQPWTSYIQATISIRGTYYVPAQTLQPGEQIETALLQARQADLLTLPAGTVLDPAQLLGRIATRRLRPGQPIRDNALRSPQSVVRGQTVRLEARGPGFVATSEGRALQNGAPGTQIQVRTATGRVVSGTIVGNGTVSVLM
jgi:flagella basal body P-ring formation protein FlgA